MGADTGIDQLVDPSSSAKFGERSNGRAEPPRRQGGRRGRFVLPLLVVAVALNAVLGTKAATLTADVSTVECVGGTITRLAVADAWIADGQLVTTYATSTGFLVRDQTEDGAGLEQGFHSREKAPDNPPQLVLTFG